MRAAVQRVMTVSLSRYRQVARPACGGRLVPPVK
jgi:hypothetical protein